jgi:hypothetical protein
MTPEMLASVSERRRLDPLTCLLMWLTALNADPVREALRLLEVRADELYNIFSGLEYEQAQMRRLRMVCELFGREQLGKLVRGRLSELLMQCGKAADFAALLRVVAQLPDWVLDARPDVVHLWDDSGAEFERPDVMARAAAAAFADAGVPLDFARDGDDADGDGANGDGESQYGDVAHGNGTAVERDPIAAVGLQGDPASGATIAGLAPLSPAEEALLATALGDLVAQQAGRPAPKLKRHKTKLPRRR